MAQAWALPDMAWAAESAPRLGSVTLGVVNPESFCQLPLHLAARLGYLADEGLKVQWQLYPDAAAAVQALQLGRVHVLSGAFASTLEAHRQGQRWTAFVLQSRTPHMALGMTREGVDLLATKNPAGAIKLAVPPSSRMGYGVVRRFLERQGVSTSAVQWLEMRDSSAILGALRRGQVHGLCMPDLVMTQAERDGLVRVMAEARTVRGTQLLFGGPMSTACLMAQSDFVKWRADQCRGLTHAMVRALKWLQTAGMLDVSRVVDERYFQGNRGLYLDAFVRNRDSWSPDGVFAEQTAANTLRQLAHGDTSWSGDTTALSHTVMNDWAKEAKLRFRA